MRFDAEIYELLVGTSGSLKAVRGLSHLVCFLVVMDMV